MHVLAMTAYEFGKMAGVIALAPPLLVGIALCIRLSRKPNACGLCIHSLTLCLGMLLSLLALSALAQYQLLSPLLLVVKLILSLGVLASLVLAIIGLATYGPPPRRGRVCAITTIVLIGLLWVVGFIAAMHSLATSPEHFVAQQYSAQPLPTTSAKPQVFEDLNFRFRHPGREYVAWNAKTFNPAVTLAYMKANPLVYVTIVAERLPNLQDANSDPLVETVRTQVKSLFSDVHLTDPKPCIVNGLSGVSWEATGTIQGQHLFYVHWDYAHQGFFYQVVVWGRQETETLVRDEAAKLVSCFEVIDRNRWASPRADTALGKVESNTFGVSVDLTGKPWKTWPEMKNYWPHAVLGGQRQDGLVYFVVIPLLHERQHPIEDGAVHSLLKLVDVDYPDGNGQAVMPFTERGLHGLTVNHIRTIDKMVLDYRTWVICEASCCYMVSVWTKKDVALEASAKEIFDAVRLKGGEIPPLGSMLTREEKTRQASLINRAGTYYFSANQFDQAIELFEAASALDGSCKDYAHNVLNCFSQLRRYTDGLAWSKMLPASAQDEQVKAWNAWFLHQLGQTEQALAIYERLFAGDYRDDNDFKNYVNLLATAQKWDQVDLAFERYFKTNDSFDLRITRAKLYNRQGKHDQAEAYLTTLQKSGVTDPRLADALVEVYFSMEQPKKALEICEAMIARGLASARVYYLKAQAECDLKWYRQAKTSLELALKTAPKDTEIQDMLKRVSGMLGEGNNSSIKNAIEPVALPKILANKLPNWSAKCLQDGFGAYYLSSLTGISFQKGKELKTTTRCRIAVKDATAVSRFSTIELDFDPLAEEIFVNELIVRDAKGEVVSYGNQNDYYLIDRRGASVASHDKTLCIPVPNLLPGHIIELTTTIRKLGQPTEFQLVRNVANAPRPMLLWGVYFLGDVNAIRYKAHNLPDAKPIEGGLAWMAENLPPVIYEPHQARFEEFVPFVILGDAAGEWDKLATAYLGDIRNKLGGCEKVATLAKNLTDGATTADEKVARLLAYVQKTCTYRPIEFGRRSRIPNTPEQTLANTYGDCKDQAVLLRALLEAAGVPSSLALVGCSWTLEPSLPSLDQFDHMILWIGQGQDGYFVDPTAKGMPPGSHAPQGLAGLQALVLEGGRAGLVTIPAYDSSLASAHVTTDVFITEDKQLEVRQTLSAGGYIGAWLRESLQQVEKGDQAKWFKYQVMGNDCTIDSVEVSDLYDTAKDLQIRLKLTLNRRCTSNRQGLVIRLPIFWEECLFRLEPVADRQTPFQIIYPYNLDSTITLHSRDNEPWIDVGPMQDKASCDGFVWQTETIKGRDTLVIRFRGQMTTGVYPAKKYAEQQSVIDKALQSVGRDVLCRPQPTSASTHARS